MKVSKQSKEILECFSSFNQSIYIAPGDGTKTHISTKKSDNSIYAEAVLEENYDKEVVLYEVKKYLQLLDTMDDPDVSLADKSLTISNGSTKCRLTYAKKETIVIPRKQLQGLDPVITFDLKASELQSVIQTGGILNLPHFRIAGEDGEIKIQALDVEGVTKDTFDVTVGTTDKTFEVFVKRDNLKMLIKDYKVTVFANCVQFRGNPDSDFMFASVLERV